MIPVSYLFNDEWKETEGEPVEEVWGTAKATVGGLVNRFRDQRKIGKPVLPSRNPALQKAAAVMNNRGRM